MSYASWGARPVASVVAVTSAPLHVVVMGVSGTGKTSVGRELARLLGFDFVEGDSHHPRANIAKMESGEPLTDADRKPWLEDLAAVLGRQDAAGRSTVLTCSALRRRYRDVLRSGVDHGRVYFLHLQAPRDVLRERMGRRTKHFMPTSLLASQLATLEPLERDEAGGKVDVTPPLPDVVAAAVERVRRARDGRNPGASPPGPVT